MSLYDVPLETIKTAIAIGLALSLLFYERRNLTPGGVVVPGYVALTLERPWMFGLTIIVAVATLSVGRYLSTKFILFGRRKFTVVMLLSFLIGWAVETTARTFAWVTQFIGSPSEVIQLIGFIIPGLIAYAMDRQGVSHTIYSLVVVSMATYVTLFFVLAL